MNNYFIFKQKQNCIQKHNQTHKQLIRWKLKKQIFKVASKNSYIDKVHSNLNLVTDEILNYGMIPLCNPRNHQFRDRQKNKQIDSKNQFRIKKFLTSKERAQLQQKSIKGSYLEKQQYIDLFRKQFKRSRDLLKQGPPLNFGLNPKLQVDRIQSEYKKNKQNLDCNKIDTKMLYYPKWKSENTNNWISKSRFDYTASVKQGWKQINIFSPQKYLGGYEETGDILRYSKKISQKPDFITRVHQNPLQLLKSKSLRKYKSHQFIHHSKDGFKIKKQSQKHCEDCVQSNIKLYKISAKQCKIPTLKHQKQH